MCRAVFWLLFSNDIGNDNGKWNNRENILAVALVLSKLAGWQGKGHSDDDGGV